MRHVSLIAAMFLLCIAAPIAAQAAAPDTGWPIEMRCVSDPVPPPADWSYDGTLFTHDSYGLHALNPNVDTPYFVLFAGDFVNSAALSPDGKWYAVPAGRAEYASMLDQSYDIDAINVYSTDEKRERYQIDWDTNYRGGGAYVIRAVRWLDNEWLLYEKTSFWGGDFGIFRINPFTGESVQLLLNIGIVNFQSNLMNGRISPDFTRAVVKHHIATGDWGVYDLSTGDNLTVLSEVDRFGFDPAVIWAVDSSKFVAVVDQQNANDEVDSEQLTLFDRDGRPLEVLLSKIGNQDLQSLVFSSTDRKLAFTINNQLFLADLDSHAIENTCLNSGLVFGGGLSWSPSTNQLAFTLNGDVVILDVDTWELYTITSNIGDVVAWGAAD